MRQSNVSHKQLNSKTIRPTSTTIEASRIEKQRITKKQSMTTAKPSRLMVATSRRTITGLFVMINKANSIKQRKTI